MRKTRISMFYLAGYLLSGGVAFFFLPELSLRLFHSSGHYPPVLIRFIGLLLFALGVLVVQVIRTHARSFYRTTLVVRSFILPALIYFYWESHDPMMLVLAGIVGLGFVFTGTAVFLERR